MPERPTPEVQRPTPEVPEFTSFDTIDGALAWLDGHIDFDLRDNIRAEQKKIGMLPDGSPTAALLDKLGVKVR